VFHEDFPTGRVQSSECAHVVEKKAICYSPTFGRYDRRRGFSSAPTPEHSNHVCDLEMSFMRTSRPIFTTVNFRINLKSGSRDTSHQTSLIAIQTGPIEQQIIFHLSSSTALVPEPMYQRPRGWDWMHKCDHRSRMAANNKPSSDSPRTLCYAHLHPWIYTAEHLSPALCIAWRKVRILQGPDTSKCIR